MSEIMQEIRTLKDMFISVKNKNDCKQRQKTNWRKWDKLATFPVTKSPCLMCGKLIDQIGANASSVCG